jgi:transposase, IS5 family
MLLVVTEVYRQPTRMYENESNRIDNRIVSITQPHIRPIVRGKAGKPVELLAKLSVSCFDQYVFLDHLSWDNFNESGDLKTQIQEYKNLTGYYPSSVHVAHGNYLFSPESFYPAQAGRAVFFGF